MQRLFEALEYNFKLHILLRIHFRNTGQSLKTGKIYHQYIVECWLSCNQLEGKEIERHNIEKEKSI